MDKEIRKLFIANFIGGLYFYVPIYALFLLDKHITLTTIVFAQLVYSLVSFLAEVPTGVLADRVGQHVSVALGYFTDLLGFVIILFFPTPITIIIAQGIRGISGAFTSGSKEALLFEYGKQSSRNYKKDFSHLSSYEVLGFALSTLITGFVVQQLGHSGFVPIFIITMAMVLIAGLISLTLKPIKNNIDTGRDKLFEVKHSIKLIKSSKMLMVLFLVVGLTYDGRYLLLELYPPQLQATHVLPFFFGAALSAGSALNYFVLRNAYRLEKPMGPKAALILLTILTGILYIAFGWFTNPYASVFSLVLLLGIMSTVSIYISDYANQHTPSHVRATVLSGISFSKEVFKTVSKLIVGALVGIASLGNTFIFYGLLLVAGAFISYKLITSVENEKIAK